MQKSKNTQAAKDYVFLFKILALRVKIAWSWGVPLGEPLSTALAHDVNIKLTPVGACVRGSVFVCVCLRVCLCA